MKKSEKKKIVTSVLSKKILRIMFSIQTLREVKRMDSSKKSILSDKLRVLKDNKNGIFGDFTRKNNLFTSVH
jgi:hypothetical protein